MPVDSVIEFKSERLRARSRKPKITLLTPGLDSKDALRKVQHAGSIVNG